MAGGVSGGDDEEIITAINVTPLVDIVLVLLIIMMVTASYIVSKSIPMDLPNAESGEESPPRTLTVSIDADDKVYVDGDEVSWDQLLSTATRFARDEREPRAVIAADRRVTHGQFIRAIDILRRANITRYAINVNPADLDDPGESNRGE